MKLKLKKAYNIFLKKRYLQYIAVFFLFILIFTVIQFFIPELAGVDGYYHIKHSYLIRTQGLSAINNFSWVNYSILKDYSSDLWLGYHLILMPFTFFKDLIFGAKLASILFSSIFLFVFYIILKKLKTKYALFWSGVMLIVNHYFLIRLLYPRGAIFSLIFLLIGLYSVFKRKYLLLFLISWLYALFYPGFILFLLLILIFLVLEKLYKKYFDINILTSTISGIIFGLVLRPDFPRNLYMLFVQDILSIFYKLKGVGLTFGMEFNAFYNPFSWKGVFIFACYLLISFIIFYKLSNKKTGGGKLYLIYYFLFIFVIEITGLALFFGPSLSSKLGGVELFIVILFGWGIIPAIGFLIFLDNKKIKENFYAFYLWIITSFLLVLTLFIDRFIEYLVPVTILSLVYILERSFKKNKISILPLAIQKKVIFLITFIIFAIILTMGINYSNLYGSNNPRWSYINETKKAAQFLEDNTAKNELIFHLLWSDFPGLFYFNHENHYISAMDPTFMYIKNEELYWKWVHLREGIDCKTEKCNTQDKVCSLKTPQIVYNSIRRNFPSVNYVFISGFEWNKEFINILRGNNKFVETPRKDYFGNAKIFKIKH